MKNMKKRHVYIIIGLLFLFIGIFVINAIVNKTKDWHSANEILVIINGYTMTLQEAIDNNVFADGASQSYTTEIPDPGHSSDNVLVAVDGYTMTLQEAIDNNVFITGASQNYTTSISASGHLATEIEVLIDSVEMEFQEAINQGKLSCSSNEYYDCYENDTYWYDSCGVREEKQEECGISECGNISLCWKCDPNNYYIKVKTKTCYDRGCSDSECYETERIEIVEEENCTNPCGTPKGFPMEYPWCYDAICI